MAQCGDAACYRQTVDLDDAILKNLETSSAAKWHSRTSAWAIEEIIQIVDGKAAASNFSVGWRRDGEDLSLGQFSNSIGYGMREVHRRRALRRYPEGVLKTLKVTAKHFRELFGNPVYRYYKYDSANLTQVRQFAQSDGVEVMVMTLDSFNKASNVIRQSTDRLQGETPLFLVQAARPILILDEPQNMESEKAIAALATLDPLMALRYSATHRNPYNVVYRLTPAEAYRQGLVKKIEVDSVVKENTANEPYLRVEAIQSQKKTVTAKITVHKLMKSGQVKRQLSR